MYKQRQTRLRFHPPLLCMSVVLLVPATATVLIEPPSRDWSIAWRLLFSLVFCVGYHASFFFTMFIELWIQVFKTKSKGWGVRTWDSILPGALICEYTGVLRRTTEVEGLLENNYIFDIDCLQTMEGLDGREVLDVFVVCWLNGTVLLDPFFCGGFSFWKCNHSNLDSHLLDKS